MHALVGAGIGVDPVTIITLLVEGRIRRAPVHPGIATTAHRPRYATIEGFGQFVELTGQVVRERVITDGDVKNRATLRLLHVQDVATPGIESANYAPIALHVDDHAGHTVEAALRVTVLKDISTAVPARGHDRPVAGLRRLQNAHLYDFSARVELLVRVHIEFERNVEGIRLAMLPVVNFRTRLATSAGEFSAEPLPGLGTLLAGRGIGSFVRAGAITTVAEAATGLQPLVGQN